jgi:hypothetical protein
VVPLSALVFLSAFVPIIGALVAGTVALVANSVLAALVVLAVVIGVNQLESHILQPLPPGLRDRDLAQRRTSASVRLPGPASRRTPG